MYFDCYGFFRFKGHQYKNRETMSHLFMMTDYSLIVWRNNAVKNKCRTDFNVVGEEKE
jgi:hypothetical protein